MFGPVDSLCIVHCYAIGSDTLYDTTIVIVIVPFIDTCKLECPPDLTITVDAELCVGIVNLSAPVPMGDCLAAVPVLSAGNEEYDLWTTWTNSAATNTAPGGCGAGSQGLFSRECTNGYPQNPPVAQPLFDDTQLVIDDDEANPIGSTGEFCWESPVVDLSMGGVSFGFDWQYRDLGLGFPFAEVYDGTSWVNVWNGPSVSAAGSENIDITAYNNSDFQVRVCLDDMGSWAWGAAFDNITVLASSATPVATNDYNGGTDLINAEFPLGTTTVTWTIYDMDGNPIECTTDITVIDPGPTLECPEDFTVTLDPGACEYYYNYVVDVNSCVGLVVDTVCNSAYQWDMLDIDPALSLSCGAAGPNNFYYRVYEVASLSLNNPVSGFESVTVWYRNSGTQTTEVKVYDYTGGPVGDVLDMTQATEVASGSMMVSGIITDSVNIPVSDYDASLYETLIVEVKVNAFSIGQTLTTTTEPNWLAAAACGIPVDMPQLVGTGATAAFPDNFAFFAPVYCDLDFGDALVQGVPSGDPIPIGTTTFEYMFEDVNGNTVSCEWTVTVNEFPDPITDAACNDEINVSPDEDCMVLITADMILEGGPYGCYDSCVVELYTDSTLTVPVPNPVTGVYAGYTIVGVVSCDGAPCWGYINIEDKLIPDLLCDTYEADCDDDVSPGVVDAGSVVTGADLTPGVAILSGMTTDIEVPVSLQGTFSSVTDVNFCFDMSHTWTGDVSVEITSPSGTSVTVYDRPGQPATFFGCASDDAVVCFDDAFPTAYMDLENMCNAAAPAQAGDFQPAEALSAFNGEEANGIWIVSFTDAAFPDDGTVNSISLEISADIQSGIPLPIPDTAVAVPSGDDSYTVTGFDACGPVELVYEDEEIDIDCTLGSGYTTMVLRHWTATDGSGNVAECTDTIRSASSDIWVA